MAEVVASLLPAAEKFAALSVAEAEMWLFLVGDALFISFHTLDAINLFLETQTFVEFALKPAALPSSTPPPLEKKFADEVAASVARLDDVAAGRKFSRVQGPLASLLFAADVEV